MRYENKKIVYEVGDWVCVTEQLKDNRATVGTIGKLHKVSGGNIPYLIDGIMSWCRNVRPASQEEIDRATKEEEIKVGDYLVKFHNYSETCTDKFIEVGCQKVTKDLFLKIGEKANWI